MLSRVASNTYWTARYIERAENTARLVNVNSHLLLDAPLSLQFGWKPLIAITGVDEEYAKHHDEFSEREVTSFLLIDEHNGGSMLSSLHWARENMRTTREIVPAEAWEQLNNLYLYVKKNVSLGLSKRSRYDFLKKTIEGCQLLTGIISGTMTRGQAYSFLQIGKYLERADMSTRILDVRSANLLMLQQSDSNLDLSPFANIQWMSVLKTLTAYQMYRHHVKARVNGADVLRFLLQNPDLPRSFAYCLHIAEQRLQHLPNSGAALRSLGKLQRQIDSAQVYELAHQGGGLHEFIDELQIGLGHVHGQIGQTYFGYGEQAA